MSPPLWVQNGHISFFAFLQQRARRKAQGVGRHAFFSKTSSLSFDLGVGGSFVCVT